MPIPQALLDALANKLKGEAVDLSALADEVTQLLANDPTALVSDASTKYNQITSFIRAMNPYGEQAIAFPSLAFANSAQRVDLANLKDRGIEVAGWLRLHHSEHPASSSDMQMTLADKAQCFYWDFRFPDDPSHADGAPIPKGGEMKNLQITKAIRIPFVYRRADGVLLLGHILIGYEGAGGM
jgi:hypothetical protein